MCQGDNEPSVVERENEVIWVDRGEGDRPLWLKDIVIVRVWIQRGQVGSEVRKWRGNKSLMKCTLRRVNASILRRDIPSPVFDLMIATNHPRTPATTNSCPLLGIGVRSSGSGESLARVRLLTSLIDKNWIYMGSENNSRKVAK
jgi:hypothetical protein